MLAGSSSLHIQSTSITHQWSSTRAPHSTPAGTPTIPRNRAIRNPGTRNRASSNQGTQSTSNQDIQDNTKLDKTMDSDSFKNGLQRVVSSLLLLLHPLPVLRLLPRPPAPRGGAPPPPRAAPAGHRAASGRRRAPTGLLPLKLYEYTN